MILDWHSHFYTPEEAADDLRTFDYMKMLYMDTVCYNPPAANMILEWLGPDHVLYGSDAPPLTSLKPRAIKLVQELDIPAADKEKIFWRNARRLLKLN